MKTITSIIAAAAMVMAACDRTDEKRQPSVRPSLSNAEKAGIIVMRSLALEHVRKRVKLFDLERDFYRNKEKATPDEISGIERQIKETSKALDDERTNLDATPRIELVNNISDIRRMDDTLKRGESLLIQLDDWKAQRHDSASDDDKWREKGSDLMGRLKLESEYMSGIKGDIDKLN